MQRSLSLHHDPICTAHNYTILGKDSSRWQYEIPKFGLYTMCDKYFQFALVRHYHLPQPHIPPSPGLSCTCRRLPLPPIIDPEVLAVLYGVCVKPQTPHLLIHYYILYTM